MNHEYSVLGGLNRAAVGRYLGVAAFVMAHYISNHPAPATELIKKVGFDVPQLVEWPVSAGLVTAGLIYSVLYWWFESMAWKWPIIEWLVKVPNLAGEWHCRGETYNADKSLDTTWEATVRITQSWDRLRFCLDSNVSGSHSEAAAILRHPNGRFGLLYIYYAEPTFEGLEQGRSAHRGSAGLEFSEDLQSATGMYFNGYGRYTYGTMTLERSQRNKPWYRF